jgi:hypothetical protein
MSEMTVAATEYSDDLLNEALLLAQQLLTKIFFRIDSIDPEVSHSWGDGQLVQLSHEISQFVEITTLITKLIRQPKKNLVAGIKESHISLLCILKAINHASLKDDVIVLSELIKYELRDNLTQWKIEYIPQTRRLLKN